MKNYFIIHALGNTANDHWYPYIKQHILKVGSKCYVPTFPPVEKIFIETIFHFKFLIII